MNVISSKVMSAHVDDHPSSTLSCNNDKAPTGMKNACKLCAPLGAALAFAGMDRSMTLMHGSQGCSTYIRRYMISHFREPLDIASSSFGEHEAVFGGKETLRQGLLNIEKQYQPHMIGICTTCLSETIGEDIKGMLRDIQEEEVNTAFPALVHVSTPSYSISHVEGYHASIEALCVRFAQKGKRLQALNIMPGLASPEDLRYFKQLAKDTNQTVSIFTDYSQTLDGGNWSHYEKIQKGGTRIEECEASAEADASLECGRVLAKRKTSAARYLQEKFGVAALQLGLPIGLRETDAMLEQWTDFFEIPWPESWEEERGRLVDAYVDAHKIFAGRKIAIFAEADLAVGLCSICDEIGVEPILVATGSPCSEFSDCIGEVLSHFDISRIKILTDVDHTRIEKEVEALRPDVLLGSSKGYAMARRLQIPLLRLGFPIHDRFGGQRLQHYGYRGALQIIDQLANTLLEKFQSDSAVGYTYL